MGSDVSMYIPEVGHYVLILALFLALVQSVVPLFGAHQGKVLCMQAGRSLATGMFVFVSVALACLAYSFLIDDFSVAYVAGHSNSLLPVEYKVSAVWGGHEGSLLLWVWMLAAWTLAVAIFSRHLPLDMVARVIAVMGMISVGFLLFTLLTSNPFDRLLPNIPADGGDLNPLLQDPGLIFHPPILYMGYVGFSVAFAFAIAALLSGTLDTAWARWSRPWTTIAWAFLTLGIALGSWWAYYELGWGGWWFWDPVENASFMPWLVGTALIHSLAVTEKRGMFKSWTILLAIFAFSLSLLGTFLVRSGVLTSVHAFANDPARGVFILGFLLFVVGGSLLLYALRAPTIKSVSSFSWMSKETFLLGNNVFLMVIMATVLLGTLYPLIADALELGKVSVGPPYFNFFFLPLMGALCLLLGLGARLNWKRNTLASVKQLLLQPLLLSAVLALLFPLIYGYFAEVDYSALAALGVFLGFWVIISTLFDAHSKAQGGKTLWLGLKKLRRSYWGMVLAHVGIAVSVMGIALNTIYSAQRDVRMEPGVSQPLAGYEFRLESVTKVRGPNYIADRGEIVIRRDGELQVVLFPEKRSYFSGGNVLTEADIDSGFINEMYVALGESLGDGAWAVRIHFKPFVRWIWLGALLMGFGGFLAVFDKRYRVKARAPKDSKGAGLEKGGESCSA